MTAQLFVVPVTHSSVCDSCYSKIHSSAVLRKKVIFLNVSWLQCDHQHSSGFLRLRSSICSQFKAGLFHARASKWNGRTVFVNSNNLFRAAFHRGVVLREGCCYWYCLCFGASSEPQTRTQWNYINSKVGSGRWIGFICQHKSKMVAALCIESTNIGADERRNGGKSAGKKRGKTSEQAG